MRIALSALMLATLTACSSYAAPQAGSTTVVLPDGTTNAVCTDGMPPPCTR